MLRNICIKWIAATNYRILFQFWNALVNHYELAR